MYVLPNVTISCTGKLTSVNVTGATGSGDEEPQLQIWRMGSTNSASNSYILTHSIPLVPGQSSQCCSTNSTETNCGYGVEKGDIVGVLLPELNKSSFLVHFSKHRIPVCILQNNITNFNLDHQNQESIGLPLISMRIVSGKA